MKTKTGQTTAMATLGSEVASAITDYRQTRWDRRLKVETQAEGFTDTAWADDI